MPDASALYIELLKRCLMDAIYSNDDQGPDPMDDQYDAQIRFRGAPGGKWPSHAHTMIGRARLDNVQFCVESALRDGVPGDLMETGVWRGGATILMRALLEVHGIRDRVVWAADSFRGLPPPEPEKYPADVNDVLYRYSKLAVSLEQVRDNFARYGLLDGQVHFLEGFFEETLPTAPIERLAVLRLDGDMYSSTWVTLQSLYDKVSTGGYVIIDDWGAIPACRQAVEDFRAQRGITNSVVEIDWTGVYWRKT